MDEPLAFEKAMADMIALMHEGGIVKYRDALRVFKRHFLLNTLRMHGGNVSRAAEHLGVHSQPGAPACAGPGAEEANGRLIDGKPDDGGNDAGGKRYV